MIKVKSEDEIGKMRRAGRIVALALDLGNRMAKPGLRICDLDAAIEELILGADAIPAFKGYRGYPATICASVDEEVVHGIPDSRRLKEGGILGLDVGAVLDGYYADAAVTIPIGRISAQATRLMDAAREALDAAILEARPGRRVSDISRAIQTTVEKKGFSVVRTYTGHGIGSRLHEDPQIPNYVDGQTASRDEALACGATLAIEPMVNEGTWRTKVLSNGWTVVTADGRLSSHFEHTVAVQPHGPEVLTVL
ncbi:MAG TPA: type I methionyl aminopeptidase [Candidatus Brocadiia bacterium]|nr:type I methionyl aminopeptidase [Candidatus Brocadiia bacterium]